MKKIILIVFYTLSLFIIKIPKYIELNHLNIVQNIGISYSNSLYNIYIKEIIPVKDSNGINYKYKYYNAYDKRFNSLFNKINKRYNTNLYFGKCKYLVVDSNSLNKNIIMNELNNLNIRYKKIIYTKKDIKKIVRSNSNY